MPRADVKEASASAFDRGEFEPPRERGKETDMRFVQHTVFVAFDKADGYVFNGKIDDLPRGVAYHPLGRRGYQITGQRMVLQASDLLTPEAIAEVNERLAKDLGTLSRDSGDGESAKGTPVDLVYVCNNGGLALNYGEAIKAQYRVRQGKATFADAVTWASVHRPELLTALVEHGTEKGRQMIIEAYQNR